MRSFLKSDLEVLRSRLDTIQESEFNDLMKLRLFDANDEKISDSYFRNQVKVFIEAKKLSTKILHKLIKEAKED